MMAAHRVGPDAQSRKRSVRFRLLGGSSIDASRRIARAVGVPARGGVEPVRREEEVRSRRSCRYASCSCAHGGARDVGRPAAGDRRNKSTPRMATFVGKWAGRNEIPGGALERRWPAFVRGRESGVRRREMCLRGRDTCLRRQEKILRRRDPGRGRREEARGGSVRGREPSAASAGEREKVLVDSGADLLHFARDRWQSARDRGEEEATLILFAAALDRREEDLRRLHTALVQPAPARARQQEARVEMDAALALPAEDGGRQQEAGGMKTAADWAPSTSENIRSNTDSSLHPSLAFLKPSGIMADFTAFTRSAPLAVTNARELSSPPLARVTAATGAFAAADASALARIVAHVIAVGRADA